MILPQPDFSLQKADLFWSVENDYKGLYFWYTLPFILILIMNLNVIDEETMEKLAFNVISLLINIRTIFEDLIEKNEDGDINKGMRLF